MQDADPPITVDNATAIEGQMLLFPIRRAWPTPAPLTVQCETCSLTAGQPVDFLRVAYVATIPANQTTTHFDVSTIDDAVQDPDEQLKIICYGQSAGRFIRNEGIGTIQELPGSAVAILDAVAQEGQGLHFPIVVGPITSQSITMQCATTGVTATPNADFTSFNQLVTIPPNTASQTLTVSTAIDPPDPNETLRVTCSAISNARFADAEAIGTIDPIVAGDFNADGQSDVLVQTGPGVTPDQQYVRLMNGTTPGATLTIQRSAADTQWVVVATPDFNRDGIADLLWSHAVTGQLIAWIMPSASTQPYTFAQSRALNPAGVLDPGWKPRATGFFNGDTIGDIVWHHQTQDALTVWLMGDAGATLGTTRTSSIMPAPQSTVDADRWRIAGSGDFNGDGKSDLLWQDQLDGWLAIWLMDGTTRIGTGISFGSRVDVQWTIAAVGDYNRDGRPDIGWHNPTTGQLAIWLLDGTTIRSVVSPDWTVLLPLWVVGPR